jgi:hypothetical protein
MTVRSIKESGLGVVCTVVFRKSGFAAALGS